MKKFLTLLLAAAMTLSLAACGSKTDDNSGNNSQPASALELLNAVWGTMGILIPVAVPVFAGSSLLPAATMMRRI